MTTYIIINKHSTGIV